MTKRYSKKKEAILNSIPIFLSKTYQIVDNPQYSNIITWGQDNSSFIIKDVATLTSTILPKHFKHNNFSSFVRQLNMYGFHKVRSNNQQGQAFEHQYFKKDNMELLPEIKRKNVLTNGNNQKMQQQPNQRQMVLAVPKNSRQLQLQRKIQQLSQKQSQLQNLVSILVQQNKQVIMQNRHFVNKMNKMDDKYKKKLQTLIFMVLMAGRGNSDKPLMIPPQAANMLKALQDGNVDTQGFNNSYATNDQSINNIGAIQKYTKKRSRNGNNKNGNNLNFNENIPNIDELMSKMLKNDSQAQLSGMSQNSNHHLQLGQQNSVDSFLKKINSQNISDKVNDHQKSVNLNLDQINKPSQDKDLLHDHIIPPSPNNSFLYHPQSPLISQKNQLSELLDNMNEENYFDYAKQ